MSYDRFQSVLKHRNSSWAHAFAALRPLSHAGHMMLLPPATGRVLASGVV
jgi:hypothetical protein